MSQLSKEIEEQYQRASINTANNLRTIAESLVRDDLSQLSLPEIENVSSLIGRILPAGNIPGLILSGLSRLPGHKPPRDIVQRDIEALFKGVNRALDKAVYFTFFAGPAAVIWGYQNLLKLAGKDAEDAFPEGTWQFYVDYALREDTARHANETHGFDTILQQHNIQLDRVDRLTSLTMAAIHILHQYDALLENEWRERIYTYLLHHVSSETSIAEYTANVYRDWEKQRPYERQRDAEAGEDYPTYRRRRFDIFFENVMSHLNKDLQRKWLKAVQEAKTNDLPAYRKQMTILGYLNPGRYHETRTPIPLKKAHVGLIIDGRYYLLAVCAPKSAKPVNVNEIRSQIAALLAHPSEAPSANLKLLAQVKRARISDIIREVDQRLSKEFNALRHTSILINADDNDAAQPLALLRQAERGIGNHALTIFDTGQTLVFDQSHIYFDGAWGAALAEIFTNEAISWAVHLHQLSPAVPGKTYPLAPRLRIHTKMQAQIASLPHSTPEASAESDGIHLKRLLALRKLFKQRNDLIQLTVNDLLILYRAIHAATYEVNKEIVAYVRNLASYNKTREAAQKTLEVLEDHSNPAILIPVDASQRSPRERLYPMSFEVPLTELDLIHLHQQVIDALDKYETTTSDRSEIYTTFDTLQREYLATLAGFGAILSKAKEIANSGESAGVGAVKLLAHMPVPLQRMLDKIPGRFDVLNDILKGREVFSNVGVVAKSSTLTRFITAKDDNDKKTLTWGVITDANGIMRISLRDFRHHIGLLQAVGEGDIATAMTQDYLDSYVNGLNRLIQDLQRITLASRETRLSRGEL